MNRLFVLLLLLALLLGSAPTQAREPERGPGNVRAHLQACYTVRREIAMHGGLQLPLGVVSATSCTSWQDAEAEALARETALRHAACQRYAWTCE